ncbi:unnamed protein product, partial [Didymodactylos carnosus]
MRATIIRKGFGYFVLKFEENHYLKKSMEQKFQQPVPPQYTVQYDSQQQQAPAVQFMPIAMVTAPSPASSLTSVNMHLLADIPRSLRDKLNATGICYIIIGLLSIGFDIGLVINDSLTY